MDIQMLSNYNILARSINQNGGRIKKVNKKVLINN